jgi:hypothetical protein
MPMFVIMNLRALEHVATKDDKKDRDQERDKRSDDVRFSDPIIGNDWPNGKGIAM